jgi:hypothetical protein
MSIAHVNLNQLEYASVNECPCYAPWYWDFGERLCVLNCSSIPGTDGTIPWRDDKCKCLAGSVWVNSPIVGCKINCNTPKASPNLASLTTCNCAADYYWNSTMKLCYLRCGSIGMSTGQNEDADTCKCAPNYFWNKANQSCINACGPS